MLDPSIFSRYKTKQDFDREREEFEFRKRQRNLQEQMGALQVQQMQRQANTPETLGMEQLLAKSIQSGGVQNLSPAEQAQLQAYDIAQRTKQSVDPRGNIITNRSVFDMLPGQINQMSPRDVMGAPMSQPALPTQGVYAPSAPIDTLDPLQAHQAAVMSQQETLGTSPAQRPDLMPTVGVNPADFGITSPYAQEDIGKEQAKAALEMQKEQMKSEMAKRASAESNRLYQDARIQDIDEALRILQATPDAAGTFSRVGSLVSESPAGRLKSFLENVQGGVAFDKMSSMREASPTGSTGLGALSEAEMDLLKAQLGEMQNTTDPNILARNLMRYRNTLMDTIHGTPEQIQMMVNQGLVSPEVASPLMQRYNLGGMSAPLSPTEKRELEELRAKYGR